MDGAHPWLDWLLVAIVFTAIAVLVWGFVKVVIWLAKNDNRPDRKP